MSLLIVLLVMAVVVTFRGIADQRRDPVSAPALGGQSPSGTRPPVPDDGLSQPSGAAAPRLAVTVARDASATASSFATAWLRRPGIKADQWHAGLAPHSTSSLLAKLKGVDPIQVPAERIIGEIRLKVVSPVLVEATVPTNSGTLELQLILTAGHWKVDALGWDQAR